MSLIAVAVALLFVAAGVMAVAERRTDRWLQRLALSVGLVGGLIVAVIVVSLAVLAARGELS